MHGHNNSNKPKIIDATNEQNSIDHRREKLVLNLKRHHKSQLFSLHCNIVIATYYEVRAMIVSRVAARKCNGKDTGSIMIVYQMIGRLSDDMRQM